MDPDSSPKQPSSSLGSETCLICCKEVEEDEDGVQSSTVAQLRTILEAEHLSISDFRERLSPRSSSEIKYHSSCLEEYVADGDTRDTADEDASTSSPEKPPPASSVGGNRRNQRFNVKKHCFFCGKSTKVVQIKGCSTIEPLFVFSKGQNRATRTKLASAALKKSDKQMSSRLDAHRDLWSAEAKYHQSCFSEYVCDPGSRPIKSKEAQVSRYEQGFETLAQFIQNTVLSPEKSVTSLSRLLQQYKIFLSRLGVRGTDNYKACSLKKKLKSHFKEKLMFIERDGHPNLVCSSEVSVDDAVEKATLERHTDRSPDVEDLNEVDKIKILHRAAGILRHEMESVNDCCDDLPGHKFCVDYCAEYVPSYLYDFLTWCTDLDSFSSVISCSDDKSLKNSLKVLSLCHNLIAQSRKIRTPITVGLGMTMYRDYSSQKLLEYLNVLGLSVSYADIRKFVAPAHQTGSGVDIPFDLKRLFKSVEEVDELQKIYKEVKVKQEYMEDSDADRNSGIDDDDDEDMQADDVVQPRVEAKSRNTTAKKANQKSKGMIDSEELMFSFDDDDDDDFEDEGDDGDEDFFIDEDFDNEDEFDEDDFDDDDDFDDEETKNELGKVRRGAVVKKEPVGMMECTTKTRGDGLVIKKEQSDIFMVEDEELEMEGGQHKVVVIDVNAGEKLTSPNPKATVVEKKIGDSPVSAKRVISNISQLQQPNVKEESIKSAVKK